MPFAVRAGIYLWCLFALPAAANAPVEVLGLFKDRAVVRSPAGAETLIRVGETKQGMTLLSADALGARVRYEGEVYPLKLSRRVRTGYAKPKQSKVAVNPDNWGQYRVRGTIADRDVGFLVDTGASVVALSSELAGSIGIDYTQGQRGRVQTAQGTADSYFVLLPEVQVGAIKLTNVRAAIIAGAYPKDVLLGMSFLRQVRMEEQAGVLLLTQKF